MAVDKTYGSDGCGTVFADVGLEMVHLNLKEQREVEDGAALRRPL